MMSGKQRLTTVVLISAMGMLLALWGLSIGASYASPPTPPSPSTDLLNDTAIVLGAAPNQVFAEPLRRVQTTTLEPAMNDLMSGTWPVYVQDYYYNWPGAPAYIYVPTKSWDYVGLSPAGALQWVISDTGYFADPGSQAWVAVSYRKRDSTTIGPRAVQQGGLIMLENRAGGGSTVYRPLTSTLIYTRYFQERAEFDHWGEAHSLPYLLSTDPTPQYQSVEENWTTWVTNTISGTAFYGKVVLSDTIFGSDLTITQFSMAPLTPTLHNRVNFTVVVQNVGVMTAWRYFATEVYLRQVDDPPPQGPRDHDLGKNIYTGTGLFSVNGDWKVSQLGPQESITMTTYVTVLAATGSGYLTGYAQVDVQDQPGVHYAWFGSNPEGFCNRPEGCDEATRPDEENNVKSLAQSIFITHTYELEVSPISSTARTPGGHTAIYALQVRNVGNMTDTYDITYRSQEWPANAQPSVGPIHYPVVAYIGGRQIFTGNYASFTVAVPVPSSVTTEDILNQTMVTVTSQADSRKFKVVTLNTVSGWNRIYLPIIRKKN
jgi:hypothetical protein